MIIRTYQESDESAVVALWRQVLPDDAPHNDPADSIRRKLVVERHLFLVAELNGKVIGTVMGGYDGHRGWIYSVAVSPDHQRQGVGGNLLRKVEEELVAMGCPKVNLQVRSSNSEVIAFYDRHGYVVEERVSMGKRLYS
jgi:ribosomal protein S18 acetylase RimI-like enzyme